MPYYGHIMTHNTSDRAVYNNWCWREAAQVHARMIRLNKTHAVFQTGYGPSGLPHMGTFGEVARTTWVQRAFEYQSHMTSELITFSDDLDALRKVPQNVPEPELLHEHLHKSLSAVPDPWHTHESYAAHNNAQLQQFLDQFGFSYTFVSATDYYKSGHFDQALRRMAHVHGEILEVVLPTLRAERRKTYSCFLPIHPVTGQVQQVPVQIDHDHVIWQDDAGAWHETAITGGTCKAQWKADWALRWYALGVDYEMSGKDLMESVKLSSKICRILGGDPPISFTYELFLDEQGHKISKSVGNGVSMEQWLSLAPATSLSQFMWNQPTRAKKIHTDLIPRAQDEYVQNITARTWTPDNPAWYMHAKPPCGVGELHMSYQTLIQLAQVSGAQQVSDLESYVRNYVPDLPDPVHAYTTECMHKAITCAVQLGASAQFRSCEPHELHALMLLKHELQQAQSHIEQQPPGAARAQMIQTLICEVGTQTEYRLDPPQGNQTVHADWFKCLYQLLLGQNSGARLGNLVSAYGVNKFCELIDAACARA